MKVHAAVDFSVKKMIFANVAGVQKGCKDLRSGRYLSDEMFQRLGIADQVAAKNKRMTIPLETRAAQQQAIERIPYRATTC